MKQQQNYPLIKDDSLIQGIQNQDKLGGEGLARI